MPEPLYNRTSTLYRFSPPTLQPQGQFRAVSLNREGARRRPRHAGTIVGTPAQRVLIMSSWAIQMVFSWYVRPATPPPRDRRLAAAASLPPPRYRRLATAALLPPPCYCCLAAAAIAAIAAAIAACCLLLAATAAAAAVAVAAGACAAACLPPLPALCCCFMLLSLSSCW